MRDLSDLISRVRSATGPDWQLSNDIHWALVSLPSGTAREHEGRRETNVAASYGGEDWRGIGPYFFGSADCTASLDDAVALCERVLPGWHWSIRKKSSNPDFFEGMVTQAAWSYAADRFKASHDSAPLALTLAVLLAKQEIDRHE